MPRKEISVNSSSRDQRLDVFLAEQIPDITRSALKRLIMAGDVRVNGLERKSSYRLREGDIIRLDYETVSTKKPEAEDISLEVIDKDDHVIIINKPSGMVVHPGAGVLSGTLVNALLFHFPNIADIGPETRPGIVHRLDKETSGLLAVARTPEAYSSLQDQFKARRVVKSYYGLVWGKMPQAEGKIDWPIGRHVKGGGRISIRSKKPKSAVTHYRVERLYEEQSLLVLKPVTGRTHQLRVHLAAAGHPIVGDKRYGRRIRKKPAVRLFLHASELVFTHPKTGEQVKYQAGLPDDLKSFLDSL